LSSPYLFRYGLQTKKKYEIKGNIYSEWSFCVELLLRRPREPEGIARADSLRKGSGPCSRRRLAAPGAVLELGSAPPRGLAKAGDAAPGRAPPASIIPQSRRSYPCRLGPEVISQLVSSAKSAIRGASRSFKFTGQPALTRLLFLGSANGSTGGIPKRS